VLAAAAMLSLLGCLFRRGTHRRAVLGAGQALGVLVWSAWLPCWPPRSRPIRDAACARGISTAGGELPHLLPTFPSTAAR